MLKISRRPGESITIGENIKIKVVALNKTPYGTQATLQIEGLDDTAVAGRQRHRPREAATNLKYKVRQR